MPTTPDLSSETPTEIARDALLAPEGPEQDATPNASPARPAPSRNSNLHGARSEKNDEFYTELADIEKEIGRYRAHFADKAVFCNCDDPTWSNFWAFFQENFDHLGLRRLVATHYVAEGSSYKLEIDRDFGNREIVRTPLEGNGDFRSPECVELLKAADIIVTNPPFSLFREYVAQLMAHDKKFLIIGSMNAITYKAIFEFIMVNRIWLGIHGVKTFRIPDGSIQAFGNIGWFTNLGHFRRNQSLILRRTYHGSEDAYPFYDDGSAINVDKVVDIPMDYHGVMGVPITFLDKYSPDQFRILGIANSARWIGYPCKTLIDGRKIYNRILIERVAP